MYIGGKIALITGASNGIGRELARALVCRGAKVALMARESKGLEDLAIELSLAGAETPRAIHSKDPKPAFAAPADVRDRSAVERAVAAVLSHFGRLDILVNCAGVGLFAPIEAMDMDDFDAMVKTNLYGPVNVTQAALHALKASRGMIVNISSGLSMRALPFLSAYAGIKSALNALSDGMRLELAPYGIRVLNYCPPMTDTGFDARSLKAPGLEKTDFTGMKAASAEKVALGIIGAMRRERRRVGGGFFRVMNALAPRLLDRMFAGMVRRFSSASRESR